MRNLECRVFVLVKIIASKGKISLTKFYILAGSKTTTVRHPAINSRIRRKSSNSNKLKAIHKRAQHRLRLQKLIDPTTNTITNVQMAMMNRNGQTRMNGTISRGSTPMYGARSLILIIRGNSII